MQVSSIQSSKNRILEEHSTSFKWLMASLFALNGAGMLAAENSHSVVNWVSIAAITAFYLGLTFSMGVAVFGQRANQAALAPLEELTAFWTLTSLSGEFDETEFNQINANLKTAMRKAILSRACGWLSFIAFSLGLVGLVIAPSHELVPTVSHEIT